jgi:DNA-directed RNA polymerase subunit RPC12/RpoP
MAKPDSYRCVVCGEEFVSAWTDEEAREELDKKFPGVPIEECELVCDDCYQKLMSKPK